MTGSQALGGGRGVGQQNLIDQLWGRIGPNYTPSRMPGAYPPKESYGPFLNENLASVRGEAGRDTAGPHKGPHHD